LLLLLAGLSAPLNLLAEPPELASLRAKAEKGNSIAQYNLGLTYLAGQDVPADWPEAFVWLTLAAENGTTGKALQNLTEEMSSPQLAEGRRRLAALRATQDKPAPAPATVATATDAQKDLSNELALAWKEADELRTALTEARRTRDEAAAQVQQLSTEITTLRRTATDLGSRNQEMEDAAVLRGRSLEETREKLAAAESRLADATAAQAATRQEADVASAQLAQQQNLIEQQQMRLTTLRGEIDGKQADLDRHTDQIKTLQAALADAGSSASDASAATAQVAALRAEAADLRQQVETANKATDEANRQLATLSADLGAARVQLVRAQSQNEQLAAAANATPAPADSTQFDALTRELAATKTNLSEAQAAAAKADALTEQVADLQANLDRATAAQRDAEDRTAALATELTGLQARLSDTEAQLVAVPAAPAGDDSVTADLRAKLSTALRSYTLLQDENERLKSAASQRATEVATLQEKLAGAQASAAGAQSEAESAATLQAELDTVRRSYTQLQEEADALRAASTAQADQITTLESELASATPAPAADPTAASRVAALTAELQKTRAALAEARSTPAPTGDAAEVDSLRQQLRVSIDQLNLSRRENDALRTRLAVITPSPASSFATPTRPGSTTAAAIQQTTPAAAPAAVPRRHVVAPGDTLSALALRYYGSPVRWAEIFEANRDRLPNERALRPGMELVIP
jgi:chromosome segregation ATPase